LTLPARIDGAFGQQPPTESAIIDNQAYGTHSNHTPTQHPDHSIQTDSQLFERVFVSWWRGHASILSAEGFERTIRPSKHGTHGPHLDIARMNLNGVLEMSSGCLSETRFLNAGLFHITWRNVFHSKKFISGSRQPSPVARMKRLA
jgi:hypothetical protein